MGTLFGNLAVNCAKLRNFCNAIYHNIVVRTVRLMQSNGVSLVMGYCQFSEKNSHCKSMCHISEAYGYWQLTVAIANLSQMCGRLITLLICKEIKCVLVLA